MNNFFNTMKKIWRRNREAANASWIIGGRIGQMGISFVVSIFTARYLGPSNYGLINYGTAYVTFFSAVCTLGINSVIIKDFIDNPDDEGKTIGTTLILRIISSILSLLMIIGIVSIIDKNEPLTMLVTGLCGVSLVFQTFDTLNYWFQSKYQSKVSSIVGLFAYILTSIYKIALLVLHKNVQWFAFANSIDYIFMAIFLYGAYKRHNGPKLLFSLNKAKTLLGKSYHYILSGMMVAIYGQTDKLMLKQMLDETSVGYYSLATTINCTWVFVLQAIIDSMYPTILSCYKTDRDEFERKNRQLYAIVIYVSILVAIVFTFGGRFLICLLYGESYASAAVPLRIVTWYTIFSYLGVARNAWIVCEDKQKYLKYMYLGATILNIVLNILFIPIWGASGAAVASLITQIFTSMVIPSFIKDMRPNVKLMIDAFRLKGIK